MSYTYTPLHLTRCFPACFPSQLQLFPWLTVSKICHCRAEFTQTDLYRRKTALLHVSQPHINSTHAGNISKCDHTSILHRENGEPQWGYYIYILWTLSLSDCHVECTLSYIPNVNSHLTHSRTTIVMGVAEESTPPINFTQFLMSQDQPTPVKSQLCSGNFYLYVTI